MSRHARSHSDRCQDMKIYLFRNVEEHISSLLCQDKKWACWECQDKCDRCLQGQKIFLAGMPVECDRFLPGQKIGFLGMPGQMLSLFARTRNRFIGHTGSNVIGVCQDTKLVCWACWAKCYRCLPGRKSVCQKCQVKRDACSRSRNAVTTDRCCQDKRSAC